MSTTNVKRKFSTPQLVMAGAIVLGLLVIGGATMKLNQAEANFEATYQLNTAKKAGLQSEIDSLKTITEEPDEIQKTIYSAVQAGSQVAFYQTEFQTCYEATNIQAALQENIQSLMKYVDMADGAGYSVWFVTDGKKTSERLTWRFATNYEFTEARMPVLWLCTDTRGELVAYTTGVYVGETGKFTDIVFQATAYGTQEYHKAELNDTAGLEDDVDYTHVDSIDIPDGYLLDANGNLVDANGNAYVPAGDEDDVIEWAGEFSDDFGDEFSQAVQDRKDAIAAAGVNGGGN